MAGDARRQLHLVAVLMSVHAQSLAQFVALVLDAKFDLFRIARGDPHAAVIGFHAHVGASRHGKRLGDFLGTGCDRGSAQQGRAGNSHPDNSRAVEKQVHIQYPP